MQKREEKKMELEWNIQDVFDYDPVNWEAFIF